MRYILLLLISYIVSGFASAEVGLNFGVYASDKPTTMVKKFKPILNDLEQAMSRELDEPVSIRMQVSSSYENGIQAIASGKVDFARLGPASYVEALTMDPAIRLLAMESKNGSKRFNGVICASGASQVQSVNELKGKRFAFGDERSTIGRYLSQQYLLQHGVTAADLDSYEYLGRHDRVGYAVAAGEFDAGALKESTFNKLLKKGVVLRPIATFQNVTKPWVAKSGMSGRVFSALRRALFEYKDPEGLKALGKDGFVAGSEEDFSPIVTAVRNNPEFFK
jgi:phosphonate transport system substrate-binding protein